MSKECKRARNVFVITNIVLIGFVMLLKLIAE